MFNCVSRVRGNLRLAGLYGAPQVLDCASKETALLELKRDASALEEREALTDMSDLSLGCRQTDR